MTTTQPGWYDDPEESNTQRYWDGQAWTPHRQPKPSPPSGVEYPPPPTGNNPPPPPSGPPKRSSNSTAVIAVIAAVAVLAVGGLLLYKFVIKHHSSSAPTSSQTTAASASGADAPPHSPGHSGPGGSTTSAPGGSPGGSTGGGESQYLSDLSAAGIDSSTARPEALVAKGHQACADLAAGQSQDEAAANVVSRSNHFFDESSAEQIVSAAVKDLCPQ